VGTTRRGDPYYTLELANKTGSIKCRVWQEAVPDWERIQPGAPVYLSGEIVRGWQNGPPELRIDSFELLDGGDPITLELNPHSPIDREELEDRFGKHVNRISRWETRNLLTIVLNHVGRDRYFRSPAAMMHHHHYIGGLAEHSIEVTDLALGMAYTEPYREIVNIDALVLICLMHDVGKCLEYEWEGPIRVSPSGLLSPHVCRGVELVATAVTNQLGLRFGSVSRLDYDLLQHAIASHHMTREWGSPVPPRTPEALILHLADLASSRLRSMADDLAESEPDADCWVRPAAWNRDPVWHFKQATSLEQILGPALSPDTEPFIPTTASGGTDA